MTDKQEREAFEKWKITDEAQHILCTTMTNEIAVQAFFAGRASMQAEVDELKAHVERLREAVLGVRPQFIPEGMILYARDKCVFCGSESMRCGDDIMHAKSCIIQSTPSQSLAALKRKHYGEAIKAVESHRCFCARYDTWAIKAIKQAMEVEGE